MSGLLLGPGSIYVDFEILSSFDPEKVCDGIQTVKKWKEKLSVAVTGKNICSTGNF